jgi:hypothetical protein
LAIFRLKATAALNHIKTLAEACSSPLEFKKHYPAQYTMAEQNGILKQLWPIHTCALPPDYDTEYKITGTKQQVNLYIAEIIPILKEWKIAIKKVTNRTDLNTLNKKYKAKIVKQLNNI